jgi:hypothetical protein
MSGMEISQQLPACKELNLASENSCRVREESYRGSTDVAWRPKKKAALGGGLASPYAD